MVRGVSSVSARSSRQCRKTSAHLKNRYLSNNPEFGSGIVPFLDPLPCNIVPSTSMSRPIAAARGLAGSS